MAGVAVVTDSTSSLADAAADRAGIVVISLNVVIDGRSQPESRVDPRVVAAALRAGKRVTTSRPSPQAFAAVYDALAAAGHDNVVSVHLSTKMSGTCEAAEVAAQGASISVRVVDSGSLGMVTGFAALSGAESARAGANPAEVAATVRARAQQSTMYFCVDNLEYLRRGGRIKAGAALIGSALSVKPLMTIADGEIRPYERTRTTSKALARLQELSLTALGRAASRSTAVDIAVHHLDRRDAAERLASQLAGRVDIPGEVVISELSPVVGSHVGPGTVGVVIAPRP
jgi:DegV family protein with EDD domain